MEPKEVRVSLYAVLLFRSTVAEIMVDGTRLETETDEEMFKSAADIFRNSLSTISQQLDGVKPEDYLGCILSTGPLYVETPTATAFTVDQWIKLDAKHGN